MSDRRPRSTAALLLLLALPSGLLAGQADSIIREAEDTLAAALVTKDRTAFERLLSEDFVLRGTPDVPRDTWIANALSMCWGSTYELTGLSVVRATEELAIATLVLTTFADPITCEPAVIRSLVTDVWARRDGEYRLVLRHSGPAAATVASQFAKTAPPPPRWERTAELSLVATGGNTDTQTLGVGATMIWRPGDWETRARANFVRSGTDDTTTAESFVAEVRQSRRLSPRADLFGRADYLINRFAGIDFRTTLDAGIGWTITDGQVQTAKIDGGFGVAHESRLAGANQTFGAATAGFLYRWNPWRTTSLDERASVSLDLASPGNWRLHNTVAVSVAMIRLLSLKVSHDLKHVAEPVQGFRKRDTILSAALVARF